MPIPKPKKNEKKKDFIERCMSDDVMVEEYDIKQRMAVCSSVWRDRNEKKSVKKQSAKIEKMNEQFKYFVKIEKAYEEDGDWYVQGIASGTDTDVDGGKMSKDAIMKFVDGLPLPLTDNHAQGDVLANLGEVVYAELTDSDQMFIKARLDKDNPSCEYIVKKVSQGKKFAFSVEGLLQEAQTTFDEVVDSFVTEYLDIIPEAISITTMPAYEPSFLQVVSKSYKKHLDKIKKEQEMKDKELKKNDEISEENVEQVVETKEDNVQVEDAEATKGEKKAKDETVESSQEVAKEDESKSDEVVTTTDKTDDESKESQEISDVEQLRAEVQELTEAIGKLTGKTEPVVEQEDVEPVKSIGEQAVELLSKQHEVVKSLNNRIEKLESMPLQKKTKAKLPVIEKSAEQTQPTTIRELIAENFN